MIQGVWILTVKYNRKTTFAKLLAHDVLVLDDRINDVIFIKKSESDLRFKRFGSFNTFGSVILFFVLCILIR